ncbi:tetratricopeptide repeat protein [Aliiglaciecola sp. SL4]|uniref:tetratricopeptide repeat protein n=1 Tax=Aliiglaciecola sp. SL4 TaxID=3239806 RepID=UPI00355BCF77
MKTKLFPRKPIQFGVSKTRLNSVLASLLLLLSSTQVSADVQVELTEPNWQFLLESAPVSPVSAQLPPAEKGFARDIQPLLTQQDFNAVAKAFEPRSLENDSAALQQLRGQVMLSLKRYDEAEEALKAALQQMPNLALAHRSLSMLYMLNKNYSEARKHLSRSIELGVADAQLYGQLAFINLNSQQPAAAIAGYQQALYLQPDNLQWQQGLLYAWLNSHNFNAAQRLVEDMIEQGQHQNPHELWLLRSQIALQRNHPEQALSSLEVALQLTPKDLSNSLLAAKLHVQHGSIPRAIELLKLSLGNDDVVESAEYWATLRQVLPWLLNQQRYTSVDSLLVATTGVEIPTDFQAELNLYRGQIAVARNANDRALKYFSRAIKQDPLLPEAVLAIAKLYQSQNQYQQAENYFVRASTLPQVQQQALVAHAQMQIEQRQFQQAVNLLQQVVKLDPNRRDIKHNISELQKIIRQEQYGA